MRFFIIITVTLIFYASVGAMQSEGNVFNKPEFGISLRLKGPFIFINEKVNLQEKTCMAFFMREGKAKRGYVVIAPPKENDMGLKNYKLTKDEALKNYRDIKEKKVKKLNCGSTEAILVLFSYHERRPSHLPKGLSSGYTIIAELNNLRYQITAFDMMGNDLENDQELSEIIKTLKIYPTK